MAQPSKDDAVLKGLMSREKLNWNKMRGLDSELLISGSGRVFPDELPFDLYSTDSFGSSLSSAVLTETDSSDEDEDEFLEGLTRRLTQSSQKLAVPSLRQDKSEKSFMANSPQSTLSGIGGWSVSSNGSPNGPSRAPSPPTTPFRAQNDTWDLISAAAGEIARLKMNNEPHKCRNDSVYSNRSVPFLENEAFSKNPTDAFNASQSVAYSLNQSSQCHQQSRREQFLNSRCDAVRGTPARPIPAQQMQTKGSYFNLGGESGRCGRPCGPPQASWLALQVQSQNQPSQSAMGAAFIGGSGCVKRECAGTGVFLPRRRGNPPESHKKSGCSTVLLPASYDAILARRNAVFNQQRRGYRPEGLLNHGLPQDWTY